MRACEAGPDPAAAAPGPVAVRSPAAARAVTGRGTETGRRDGQKKARRAPSAANAPANERRSHRTTRGRETMWSRMAAAASP